MERDINVGDLVEYWEGRERLLGRVEHLEREIGGLYARINLASEGKRGVAWRAVRGLLRVASASPSCGHSACRQHWIETDSSECVHPVCWNCGQTDPTSVACPSCEQTPDGDDDGAYGDLR